VNLSSLFSLRDQFDDSVVTELWQRREEIMTDPLCSLAVYHPGIRLKPKTQP